MTKNNGIMEYLIFHLTMEYLIMELIMEILIESSNGIFLHINNVGKLTFLKV